MLARQRRREITERIRDEFAHRSLGCTFGQPVAFLLVLATTRLPQRAPHVAWFGLAGALGLCVFQAALLCGRLLRESETPGPRGAAPRTRDRAYAALMASWMTCFFLWGVFAAWSIVAFGFRDPDTLALLLYHAAICFSAVNVIVQSRHLMLGALSLMFIPPIAAQVCFGGLSEYRLAVALVINMAYLTTLGMRLCGLYQRQIEDRVALDIAANQDSLTGLPNRLYMRRALDQATADRVSPLGLLYIDLDEFKQINDRHNHRVGDLFLQESARRLAEAAGEDGLVGRLGGDEFVILLRDRETATSVAEALVQARKAPVVAEGNQLRFSASIGISIFPDDAGDADELLRAADHAMYEAKRAGRGQYRFFRETDAAESAALTRLADALSCPGPELAAELK